MCMTCITAVWWHCHIFHSLPITETAHLLDKWMQSIPIFNTGKTAASPWTIHVLVHASGLKSQGPYGVIIVFPSGHWHVGGGCSTSLTCDLPSLILFQNLLLCMATKSLSANKQYHPKSTV